MPLMKKTSEKNNTNELELDFDFKSPFEGPLQNYNKNYKSGNDAFTNNISTNTTLCVVATDANLNKAQAQRVAIMAQDGFARSIRPVHTPFDGDTVFPEIDEEKWIESNRIEKKKDENHNYDFTFITYNKIKR